MKPNTLTPELLNQMDAYWRATNYLSVGQIYLLDNPLLKRPLKLEHVKPRLLGHWGTTPGLNFIYVHLNRGSQITFSALGQRVPLEQKEKWDADFTKRKKIQALLKDLIPEFTVRLGGTTSIDVTKLGIDKAYGIKKLREILGIELEEMLFAGDALFPGGNDYPVKEAGVVSIQVNNAEETKRVIETFLAS